MYSSHSFQVITHSLLTWIFVVSFQILFPMWLIVKSKQDVAIIAEDEGIQSESSPVTLVWNFYL